MAHFAVTFDYRCPFARNAHEHVVAALRSGADLEVDFVPFSLSQTHVAEGEPDIWERPDDDSGLLALQVAVVVRDRFPERFLDVHEDLFALRHDRRGKLKSEAELRTLLHRADVDHDAVLAEVAEGGPLDTVRKEHERAAADHSVWGVPTFIAGERAAFVRLMERPADPRDAVRTVERVLDLLAGWLELNEFKHTSIPR
jgi:protein-disulfide isomerase